MTTWGRREKCFFNTINGDILEKNGFSKPNIARFNNNPEQMIKDFEEAGFVEVKVWY
jgi:hypothetical protein